MNVGFIGVGGIAQPHLQNVSQMDGVHLSAVCDTFADRSQASAEKYGAKPYTDYHEMLKSEKLDACYVCLIPGVHGDLEVELAAARIPFYMEKPVHLDLDVCQRVIDELARTGTISGVGYQWRYTAASRAAQRFAAAHKVSLVEGWWYGGFVGVPWWRQMKLSGGQLVEQTTHVVDMARYLAGEVHTVFAAGATGAMAEIENYDIHDTSVCTLLFDSGAIGQITSGCVADQHGGSRVDVTAKGRNWSAWTNNGEAILKDGSVEKNVKGRQNDVGNGDRAFIEAVRSGDPSGILSPYASGAQTLAITLAANESMLTGQPVKVRRLV